MGKTYLAFLVFVFIGLSCKLSTGSDKKYLPDSPFQLRLHLEPGSSYAYNVMNESEVKIHLQDKEVQTENRSTVGISYSVNRDSAGNYLLHMVYNRLHLYSRSGDKETEFNTDTPFPSNPTEKMLALVKNTSLIVTINVLGEVKQIDGYKELSERLISELNNQDMESRQMAEAQLNKIIGPAVIQKNLDQLFRIFPDSAIRVGDKWKINSVQDTDFPLRVSSTFQLTEMNGQWALVNTETKLECDRSPLAILGYSVIPDLQGREKASYQLDPQTGMVLNGQLTSEIKGRLITSGREIPIQIKLKLTIEGKRTRS